MSRKTPCAARVRTSSRVPYTSVSWFSGLLASLCLLVVPSPAPAGTPGFIENQGQIDARVLFCARGSAALVYLTRDGAVFDFAVTGPPPASPGARAHHSRPAERPAADPLRRTAVRVRFDGASPPSRIEAREEVGTRYHFFVGDDPSRWRPNLRAYREIVYRDLWPGVDIVFRENGGTITYEAVAAPGAATDGVRLTIEGDLGSTPLRSIAKRAGSSGENFFAANTLPGGLASPVDDPGYVSWGTFIGGSDLDGGVDVAVDPSGHTVVLGETYSLDFPATMGAYDVTYNGWVDMFIGKLSADGSTLEWCTFLGSSDPGVADVPVALALDGSGNPIVTGCSSAGYPVTAAAYDTTANGGDDVVVTKLSSDGASVVWSTFLGGSDYDFTEALVLDGSGNAVVTGGTYSANYPTTAGVYDPTYSPSGDVFVSKLSANGSTLKWSTFVGGGEGGAGTSIALDASENPVITGYAGSDAFPTTSGAYDETWNGRDDVFVSKLSSSGQTLMWSTFLGGAGNDDGVALVVDPARRVIVAGSTGSADFPTTLGAWDDSWGGGSDVFVTMLSSSGSSLVWSTFLGGSSDDGVSDLALDSNGSTVVAGTIFATTTSDFPTTYRTLDGSFNGGGLDGFVSRLVPGGRFLTWSSFVGGNGADEIRALVLDSSDDPVLAGTTDSPDFPVTPGAYGETINGTSSDAFVLRLDLEDPTGIEDAVVPPIDAVLRCAPNPFVRTTLVRYTLEEETEVDLRVFDVLGRLVSVLDGGRRPAGTHEVAWDGRSTGGRPAAAGVYFVRLIAGGRSFERKVAVVR